MVKPAGRLKLENEVVIRILEVAGANLNVHIR
jgi:hypothetical protein